MAVGSCGFHRLVAQALRRAVTVSVLLVLKRSINNRFTTKSSQAICNLLRAQASRPYKSTGTHLLLIITRPYIKGRRKRGRPPKKWIDNIKEDVKLMEFSIGETLNLTRDREN